MQKLLTLGMNNPVPEELHLGGGVPAAADLEGGGAEERPAAAPVRRRRRHRRGRHRGPVGN